MGMVLARGMAWLLEWALAPLALAFLACLAWVAKALRRLPPEGPRLVFGPTPLISNKHWARAFKAVGRRADTWMHQVYAINRPEDFDRYLFTGGSPLAKLWQRFGVRYWAFAQSLFLHDVVHAPMSGWVLGSTPLAAWEPHLMRWGGQKSVIMPFGGDFYRYGQVLDPALRHALLMSYPQPAREEARLQAQVSRWVRHADAIVAGVQFDGLGRWEALPFCPFALDLEEWPEVPRALGADAREGPVVVAHCPNHRGFKGTEFVVRAVEKLQGEGLQVELRLVEKVSNAEVKAILQGGCDLLVEQLIFSGHAFNALEGMACGLPVIANTQGHPYAQAMRRYSHLESCPIVPSDPEGLLHALRFLVTHPEWRLKLGAWGRGYVARYHSLEAFRGWMGAVHGALWSPGEASAMRHFHPLWDPLAAPVRSPLHPEPQWWS